MKINKSSWIGRLGLFIALLGVGSWVIFWVKDLDGWTWIPTTIFSIGGALYVAFGNEFDE